MIQLLGGIITATLKSQKHDKVFTTCSNIRAQKWSTLKNEIKFLKF